MLTSRKALSFSVKALLWIPSAFSISYVMRNRPLHYRICMNKGVKYEPIINTVVSSLREISMFANPETGENKDFVFSYSVIKSYLFGCNSSFCHNPTVSLLTLSHLPVSFLIPSRPLVSLTTSPVCQKTRGVCLTTNLRRKDYNLFLNLLVVVFLRCHWLSLRQRALFFMFRVWMTVTLPLAVPCSLP